MTNERTEKLAARVYQEAFDPLADDNYRDEDMSFDLPHSTFDEEVAKNEIYKDVHEVFCEDQIVVNVIRKLEARSQAGMKKFGETMFNTPRTNKELLEEIQNEVLDAANYIEWLITTKAKLDEPAFE